MTRGKAPEASISYVRSGKRLELGRIAADTVLASTHPLWHRLDAQRSFGGPSSVCLVVELRRLPRSDATGP